MMEEINLTKWTDFAPKIKELREKHAKITLPDGSIQQLGPILFRGQENAAWELKTTLERRTTRRMNVVQYIQAVNHCVNELESFTGKRWNNKIYPDLREEIEGSQDSLRVHLPCYEYLVYLRHHGFPSPLLDWTTSPYIAAYFAYCDATQRTEVAVYAYVSTTTGGRSMRGCDPMITLQGPFVTTDSRHFAQKALYTVATEWAPGEKQHYFCPHKMIFARADHQQDLLVRITLPNPERAAALHELDDYNINHFALFQSEDALVRTLAMKQFEMAES